MFERGSSSTSVLLRQESQASPGSGSRPDVAARTVEKPNIMLFERIDQKEKSRTRQTDVNHPISDEEIHNNQLDPKHSAYDMIYNPKQDIIANTQESQSKKIHFTSKDSAERPKCKIKPSAEKSKMGCKNKTDDNFEYGNDLKIEKVKSEPVENTNNLKNHKDDREHDTCPEKPDALKDPNETDEDRLFLLSLLKPLKTIPKSYKLPTKIKLMEIVHKAQEESGVFHTDKARR
ncbi:hypothetical protein EVAR_95702_1 [Eumeta japonica]|uniref:BESS domain-containing protein n=1 Tax=Eumeta variegata TaxID=151549 RepID=A0A4C1VKM5_EUMVA|nr:hypothetical protein EVAR_95702_1 [Eumeta japonica]